MELGEERRLGRERRRRRRKGDDKKRGLGVKRKENGGR